MDPRARAWDSWPHSRHLVRELACREDGLSDGESLVTGQPATPVLPSVIARYQPTVMESGARNY